MFLDTTRRKYRPGTRLGHTDLVGVRLSEPRLDENVKAASSPHRFDAPLQRDRLLKSIDRPSLIT